MDKAKTAKPSSSTAKKAPRIVQHIQSITVNDGQTATLRCNIKCKF